MFIKSMEEVLQEPGVTAYEDGLQLSFSSFINWYGAILGFDCPRCEQPIDWEWIGKLPSITTPKSIVGSGVTPKVSNATLIDWGHRWIQVRCLQCETVLTAENF